LQTAIDEVKLQTISWPSRRKSSLLIVQIPPPRSGISISFLPIALSISA
jgi:hypothetical protein